MNRQNCSLKSRLQEDLRIEWHPFFGHRKITDPCTENGSHIGDRRLRWIQNLCHGVHLGKIYPQIWNNSASAYLGISTVTYSMPIKVTNSMISMYRWSMLKVDLHRMELEMRGFNAVCILRFADEIKLRKFYTILSNNIRWGSMVIGNIHNRQIIPVTCTTDQAAYNAYNNHQRSQWSCWCASLPLPIQTSRGSCPLSRRVISSRLLERRRVEQIQIVIRCHIHYDCDLVRSETAIQLRKSQRHLDNGCRHDNNH